MRAGDVRPSRKRGRAADPAPEADEDSKGPSVAMPVPKMRRTSLLIRASMSDERDCDARSDDTAQPGECSFLALIEAFSLLQLPEDHESRAKHETTCPVCGESVRLGAFAEHVRQCAQRFDAEQDRPLSLALARADDQFVPPTACVDGRDCRRCDAQHFVQLTHPPVACPLCGAEYAVFEIDAHVTLCLAAPPTRRATSRRLPRSSSAPTRGEEKKQTSLPQTRVRRGALTSPQLQEVARLVLACKRRGEGLVFPLSIWNKAAQMPTASAMAPAPPPKPEAASLTALLSSFQGLGLTAARLSQEMAANSRPSST